MNKICPNCGSTMSFRPAGVSRKTGKPYAAFMSCPNRACNYTENLEDRPVVPAQPIYQPPVAPIQQEKQVAEAVVSYQDEEKQKQARIARESVLSTLAKVMKPQDDLMVAARSLASAADILMQYVYTGSVSEELSDAELEALFNK